MKKILILFGLLPFSLLADLNPSDLNDIEGQLDRLITTSSKIENDTDEIVDYVSLLTGRCYEIIQEQNATQSQIEKIRSLLATLNQTVDSFKGDVNTYLVSIDTNLHSAKTSLGYCENYLYDIKNTTLNIYEVLSELGTISSELTDLKNTMISKFDMCQSYFGDFLYFLSGLLTVADQLKEDTGVIVNDISTLKDMLLSFKNGRYGQHFAKPYTDPIKPPIDSYAVLSVSGTNYFSSVLSYFDALLMGQYYTSQTSFFAVNQNYIMISNLQSSVSIQKDISTNVAYIASIVSNMYAKSDNTDITNAYDQASNEYENKIKEDYESKEGELDQYGDKITARNQSFKQNEDLVGQFTSLIETFRFDSLPEVATISIVNFKFGDNSALPSTSSISIDIRRFAICFRAIRFLSSLFYWGIVLVLGYKITFIFVKFVRSNVLGIIPSTNKSDDGSFL